MDIKLPPFFHLSDEVTHALLSGMPIVALESAVITHGLPYPQNLELARDLENEVRAQDCVPATIALLDGFIHVGVGADGVARLAQEKGLHKISVRDFAPGIAQGWSGGTTVAGTMLAAHAAGIRVFATGGIGGVHRSFGSGEQSQFDISTDLLQLAKTPMIVVCAGAKAILDLPATIEYLETAAVPVIGYQTDDFPAFYTISSGLRTSARSDSPSDVVGLARAHWGLGLQSALLVVQPPPAELALSPEQMESAIQSALDQAKADDIRGQEVTPFLLARVSELTGGGSVKVNLALLRNNARLAAAIAGNWTVTG